MYISGLHDNQYDSKLPYTPPPPKKKKKKKKQTNKKTPLYPVVFCFDISLE